MNPKNALERSIGTLLSVSIRRGIRLTGRRVQPADWQWLQSPFGAKDAPIGAGFYEQLAADEHLTVAPDPDAGLIPDFERLRSPDFNPDAVAPLIREFYEHTARFQLEAWSEAALSTRMFLWTLTRFVSRSMNQLNFPVSAMELAGGMTSTILPMVDAAGNRRYTGWLRTLPAMNRVIYTGLYSVGTSGKYPHPCVKVSFPLPSGSATVFLRPEATGDGGFRLISKGRRPGDPGFYRMTAGSAGAVYVRYLQSLQEHFYLYLDAQQVLRCEHTVDFMGLRVLRLHYKIVRLTTA
ncbi:MAG: hypothetical protein EOP52_04085 [Sphingobacteriales bacterium]|nr:MAG: hypothetical protein EOP52_04085 [Sphingobacteriales bacterium]